MSPPAASRRRRAPRRRAPRVGMARSTAIPSQARPRPSWSTPWPAPVLLRTPRSVRPAPLAPISAPREQRQPDDARQVPTTGTCSTPSPATTRPGDRPGLPELLRGHPRPCPDHRSRCPTGTAPRPRSAHGAARGLDATPRVPAAPPARRDPRQTIRVWAERLFYFAFPRPAG